MKTADQLILNADNVFGASQRGVHADSINPSPLLAARGYECNECYGLNHAIKP